ncbi:hypothetical protein FI667_g11516, partial [Globisporangium splendens]
MNTAPPSAAAATPARAIVVVRGADHSTNRSMDRKMTGATRTQSASGSSASGGVSKEEKKKIVIKQELMHQVFYRTLTRSFSLQAPQEQNSTRFFKAVMSLSSLMDTATESKAGITLAPDRLEPISGTAAPASVQAVAKPATVSKTSFGQDATSGSTATEKKEKWDERVALFPVVYCFPPN